MTAWISRIKLTNFKAYQNAEFNFPQPNNNGGNLMLIGALNGHGKTTLLEALYLGLYGEKSIDILKRAVSYKDKTPNDLLENALSFKAKDDWKKQLRNLLNAGKPVYVHKESLINIQILIDIGYIDEQNTQNTLTVNRIWSFQYDNKKQDFVMMKDHEQRFQHTQNGVPKWIDNEEQFFEIFSAYVPNYNHSRFFLFDGEKLKDIGNKNAFIVSGLNDLIGVSLLDNEQEGKKGIKQALEDRLNELSRKNKKHQKEQQEWQQKEQQAKNRSADIEQKQQRLDELQEEERQLQSQKDDLTSRLSGRDAQSTDELRKEKENIERQKQEWKNNIQAALKQLPLYLLPKKEFDAFSKNIKKEFERIKLENNRKRLEPNLKKFNVKFFEEFKKLQGQKEANLVQQLWKENIEEAIKTAWHSLYYPLSDNEAEYVRHNYLSEINHQDIATTINIRKKQGLPEIQQQLQQSENASKRLSEIDEELNTAKIENRDELLKQFTQIDEEINKSQHQQGALGNEINRLHSELQTLNAEIQTIRKNLVADGDLETEKLQRLINAIDLLRERLIVQKQQDLQNNTLKVYQRISHDERVRSVYIAEQKIAFLDSNNNELADDNFSAGERQLQLTALTLALSKTTGFIAPMVIDTPLARLDENNREKLLNYLSSLPQQVILLTQSGEINRNQCDEIFAKNQVSKTYLVQSKDYDEGRIATVSENQYFIKE
ncbi:MAG: AAA family ATPase [Neisseriaceae bacterium]|nr:AAA family ATPase [Neisseriaceae bacterium]